MTYILGPLASEEATRLITWPADGVLTYDYGVARRMIEVTSGHPYYLQLLCFEVFNRCEAAGWVNQRDVDLVSTIWSAARLPTFARFGTSRLQRSRRHWLLSFPCAGRVVWPPTKKCALFW